MNSREALDILDRLRAGDDDSPGEVEARTARAVVAADPDLTRIVARREAFDRRATEAISEVAIPVDFHERLLGTLGLEPTSTPATEAIARRTTRRGWMLATAASVAGAVGFGAWWFQRTRAPEPTTFDYHRAAVAVFDGLERLPVFEEEARLPWTGWEHGRVRVAERPRALSVGPHTVAAYEFVLPTRSGGRARGVLVAIPTELLENPPGHEYFDADDATYTQQYASVTWVEREWTYVCVVDDRTTLEELAREFDVTPA